MTDAQGPPTREELLYGDNRARLTARIAELEAERDRALAQERKAWAKYDEALGNPMQYQAENQRLRAALKRIAAWAVEPLDEWTEADAFVAIGSIARAALTPTEEPDLLRPEGDYTGWVPVGEEPTDDDA